MFLEIKSSAKIKEQLSEKEKKEYMIAFKEQHIYYQNLYIEALKTKSEDKVNQLEKDIEKEREKLVSIFHQIKNITIMLFYGTKDYFFNTYDYHEYTLHFVTKTIALMYQSFLFSSEKLYFKHIELIKLHKEKLEDFKNKTN